MTICVGHHYAQINTNNVNKTCALFQITGDKDNTRMPFTVVCFVRTITSWVINK